MRRSIGSFNIQEAPCGFKLLKIGMLKFLFRAQNYFQMPSPSGGMMVNFFFVKAGISDRDFLLIYQALKTRPCRPSLLRNSPAKVNSIPSNSPYFKNKNFYSVEIPHLSQKMFKFPTPEKDDGQITAGCPGGMLKLRINLHII